MKKKWATGVFLIAVCFIATAAEADGKAVTVIERAGYFETHGNVFDIPGGKHKFVVKNMSGKDAGFVFNRGRNNIAADKTSMKVILIKNGEQGEITLNLTKGDYTYFCPIIPTPPYPLRVK